MVVGLVSGRRKLTKGDKSGATLTDSIVLYHFVGESWRKYGKTSFIEPMYWLPLDRTNSRTVSRYNRLIDNIDELSE